MVKELPGLTISSQAAWIFDVFNEEREEVLNEVKRFMSEPTPLEQATISQKALAMGQEQLL